MKNYCHNDWIIDLGYSFYMIPYREWFNNYKLVTFGIVYMSNDQSCVVTSMGNVIIKLWHESLAHISEKGLIELKKQGWLHDLKKVRLPSINIMCWESQKGEIH